MDGLLAMIARAHLVVKYIYPALEFQSAALYPSHRSVLPVAREFSDGFAAAVDALR